MPLYAQHTHDVRADMIQMTTNAYQSYHVAGIIHINCCCTLDCVTCGHVRHAHKSKVGKVTKKTTSDVYRHRTNDVEDEKCEAKTKKKTNIGINV